MKNDRLLIYADAYFSPSRISKLKIKKDDVIVTTKVGFYYLRNIVGLKNKIFTTDDLLKGKLDTMKFDYIIGNPPYQNANAKGDSGKLWKKITIKVMGMFEKELTFLTPRAAADMLKHRDDIAWIDYTADLDFDVGVKIIAWGLSKTPPAVPKIISLDGSICYNSDLFDQEDRVIQSFFDKIHMINKDNKLFKKSTFKKTTTKTLYPVFENFHKDKLIYSVEVPSFNGRKKLAISESKAYRKDNFIFSDKDFGGLYNIIDITDFNQSQIDNILSFLLSPLYIKLAELHKKVYASGWNKILVYTPIIDHNVPHNDKTVAKSFGIDKATLKEIEGYVL